MKLVNFFLCLTLLASLTNTYTQNDSIHNAPACPSPTSDFLELSRKASPYKFLGITPQSSPQEIDTAIDRAKEHLSLLGTSECDQAIKSLMEEKINAVTAQRTQ